MEPVASGSEENKKFFKYTPYGSFKFGTINEDAAAQIEVGKSYIIDISEATTTVKLNNEKWNDTPTDIPDTYTDGNGVTWRRAEV